MATDKSYIGVGKVHVRPFGATTARRYVGNVGKLNLKQTLDVKKQNDHTKVGGGVVNRIERLTAVEAEMSWLEFNGDNLAQALGGDKTTVVAATITAESQIAYKGALVRLNAPPNAITSVTHTSGTPVYVAGTDYTPSPGGIVILAAGAITDAQVIKVTYTNLAYEQVEGALRTGTELEVFFEGLNEAESGNPVLVDCWRMRVPPADELALIGDNFGELVFKAELLKDTGKGAGLSGFVRIQKV